MDNVVIDVQGQQQVLSAYNMSFVFIFFLLCDYSIDLKDVNIFFAQKEAQNDDLASWNDSTKKKLRSLFLKLLSEADLVKWTDEKKKTRKINRVFISLELENYLKSTDMSLYKAIAGVN